MLSSDLKSKILSTYSKYNEEDKWTGFPIKQDEDLKDAKILVKSNYEKFK